MALINIDTHDLSQMIAEKVLEGEQKLLDAFRQEAQALRSDLMSFLSTHHLHAGFVPNADVPPATQPPAPSSNP